MVKRVIYQVNGMVVDENGTFNNLKDYPKAFDSKFYGNDADKTLMRAFGEYYNTIGAMCKRDDRQIQTVTLMSADGSLISSKSFGKIADLPDPNPEDEGKKAEEENFEVKDEEEKR